MTTLLFGSERDAADTQRMPTHAPATRVPAGADQVVADADTELMPAAPPPPSSSVRWTTSQPSLPPPIGVNKKRPSPVLPAMMTGLLSTAAVWLGLALFVIAAVYPMSDVARVWLTLAAGWLVAAVIAYTLSSRLEHA